VTETGTDPHPPPPAGIALRAVERWRGGNVQHLDDQIAEEVPVAFVYNDEPFAVMMATPADLDDFATGFAISEGIVEHARDVRVEQIEHLIEGIEIRLRIPAKRAEALARRGVCGSELLETALRHPAPVTSDVQVSVNTLRRALGELRHAQTLGTLTGATHAAGWAGLDGGLQLAREDVGRHNALDKLIGAMAAADVEPGSGFLVVTSRASYEMAMKAASANIALMAAISAPTALAITLAEHTHLTLIGFAREDGHAVYTHPQRLLRV